MTKMIASALWMGLLALAGTCEGIAGPEGPAGAPGPQGAPGKDAVPIPTDCPAGYILDTSETKITLCKKGDDEVVRVGTGNTAFWIDRYEATVWEKPDGSGKGYGQAVDDYPASFPRNGQLVTSLYALSKGGGRHLPSDNVTWFQANEACRASGKRLPTSTEWLTAARGTIDPGASNGSGGTCATDSGGVLRATGLGSKCVSDWGAQDMIGNLWEHTNDWLAGAGTDGINNKWPDSYRHDLTANIASAAYHDGKWVPGLPSAVIRGGECRSKEGAGVFALMLNVSPGFVDGYLGFRCMIPR